MKRTVSQFNMFETYKPMSGDKVNLDGDVVLLAPDFKIDNGLRIG